MYCLDFSLIELFRNFKFLGNIFISAPSNSGSYFAAIWREKGGSKKKDLYGYVRYRSRIKTNAEIVHRKKPYTFKEQFSADIV